MRLHIPLALASVIVLSGCAIAPLGNGQGYAVGFAMSGSGASAADIGNTAGKVLTAAGVPAGSQIGTLLGYGLGLVGIGGGAVGTVLNGRTANQHAVRAARLEGEGSGWDQREQAASRVPQPIAEAS